MTIYYGIGDEERLYADFNECVLLHLDGLVGELDAESRIYVTHYRKRTVKPPLSMADDLLQTLMETLDEEYGDPEGDYTEPDAAMKAAAENFIRRVSERYFVWQCEPIPDKKPEEVDPRVWIKENARSWLEVGVPPLPGEVENVRKARALVATLGEDA